jgi:hypothetical protein
MRCLRAVNASCRAPSRSIFSASDHFLAPHPPRGWHGVESGVLGVARLVTMLSMWFRTSRYDLCPPREAHHANVKDAERTRMW